MTTRSADPRRASVAVAVVAPLTITAIGVALQLLWLPRMPDPIAIHWSGSTPDGFGPPWALVALTAGVNIGLVALFALLGRGATREGAWTSTHRLLGAIAAASVVFLAVALTWSAGLQVGVADAAAASDSATAQLAGAGAGIVAGVVAWLVQPRARAPQPRAGARARPLDLVDGERAVWLRTVVVPPALLVTLIASTVILAVVAVVGTTPWYLTAGILALSLVIAGFAAFRVRVDARGLVVRSVLGFPRFRVAAADVVSAGVVEVAPIGDFGGWGLRGGRGGEVGVILRGGEALSVERAGKAPLVVTVDDAGTAAALLQAVAARA